VTVEIKLQNKDNRLFPLKDTDPGVVGPGGLQGLQPSQQFLREIKLNI
jgi:hypothetical protein